jgi:catechol 2,3-dioxygenase-like lactoylglutathione lyase family enzyme
MISFFVIFELKKMKGVLHHIEIYVSDLKKTIEFWSWLLKELEYVISQQFDGGISYKLNDSYIVFVQTEKEFLNDGYHRKRKGLTHLAFHVNTKVEVDWFTEELKKKNVNIL